MKKKHDEQACFRCRLHALWVEFQEKEPDKKFLFLSMAEAAGCVLAQLDGRDTAAFMLTMSEFACGVGDENHTTH